MRPTLTGGASCATDANCLSDSIALLKNQRVGLIDPDTPKSAMTKTGHDGKQLNLVVSALTRTTYNS